MLVPAATCGHLDAMYAIAVIQFNRSGGSREYRSPFAAARLCTRAAKLGYVPAIRELGFCLRDGYGIHRSLVDGRRLITFAKAQEMLAARTVGVPKQHTANRFLVDWFSNRPLGDAEVDESCSSNNAGRCCGLKPCSNVLCGRPETRRHEFRRCSVCAAANYCSRSCQAKHWRMGHMADCEPREHFPADGN
jgi:hypothetical protein